MWLNQAATDTLLTSDTDRDARRKQDKCIYFEQEAALGLSGHGGRAASGMASSPHPYFNKHQAQTRLGASSLRNVSNGSAITHNKWAYANSGVCAMHKSVFGECSSDTTCWYAIILKSIKVEVQTGLQAAPDHAFVFSGYCSRKLMNKKRKTHK